MPVTNWIALIGGISGIIAAVATVLVALGKLSIGRVTAQSTIIGDLQSELDRLTTRVDELECEYELLQRKYDHVLGWAIPRGYRPPASW